MAGSAPRLGVCYYPEHWPEADWPAQASRMRELGIELVRIGEFAWSRLEPHREQFEFDWLDRAIEVLADAGLEVVLGTPTACPPKWLVDEKPEILPLGEDGLFKGFGSRRHYCFSSPEYWSESDRIVSALAERYGQHQAVVGWQLDNELGHHGTVQSYSQSARDAFRAWCEVRYESIDALNSAWGNVFWSMEYSSFFTIDPPAGAVTETNPAHRLAWRRFCSDQVVRFARRQAKLLRRNIAERQWLTHNFIGHFTEYDSFRLAQEVDLATWDSYPLGSLEQLWFDEQTINTYRRTGHPDLSAFQHDLHRAIGAGRWGVMEQQPGPVNWAAHNAVPLPGMVRLWGWEAIAHGAEVMSYFRWQQAPFAQEQMHAGLNRPDGEPSPAAAEVAALAAELAELQPSGTATASVALVFDFEGVWINQIQPQSAGYDAMQVVFEFYSAARQLGLDVDIVPSTAPLNDYRIVLLPVLPHVSTSLAARLQQVPAQVLIGPRAGSKSAEFSIPGELPPGPLQRLIPLRVTQVDTLRPGWVEAFAFDGREYSATRWLESVDTELSPQITTANGSGLYYRYDNVHYLAGLASTDFLRALLGQLCAAAELPTIELTDGLRLRRLGDLRFAFNYGPGQQQLPVAAELLLGQHQLAVGELAVWRGDD